MAVFFFPLSTKLQPSEGTFIPHERRHTHTHSLLFLFLFTLPLTLLGWVPSSSQWGRCAVVFYPRGTPFTLFHLSIGCFFIMHSWFSLSRGSSHRPRVFIETCDWPTVKGLWRGKWWILPFNEMCCCCSGLSVWSITKVHQNAPVIVSSSGWCQSIKQSCRNICFSCIERKFCLLQ